jgi:hypothetical protein
MSIQICKNFNLCIKDFLNEILKISKLKGLLSLSVKINTLFKINICSNIIINTFIECILPDENLIMEQDRRLFTNLINKERNNNGEFVELMLELNSIWDDMSENNKEKVFEYLLVLNFYAKEHIRHYLTKKNDK